MKIIAIANQKGGVGKTTVCLNLGAALTLRDYRVLLIDMDSQGNLSEAFGIKTDEVEVSMYDVLIGDNVPLTSCMFKKSTLHLAPANIALQEAEIQLVADELRAYKLKGKLDPIKDQFDFVLIDCPPSIGLLTTNAFVAASEVYVVISPGKFSLKGLKQLRQRVDKIKALNPTLDISKIILNGIESNEIASKLVVSIVREEYPKHRLFETFIRKNTELRKAEFKSQTIFEHNFSCNASEDFINLCAEMLELYFPARQKRSLGVIAHARSETEAEGSI
jgi:chromosome partitioning protein